MTFTEAIRGLRTTVGLRTVVVGARGQAKDAQPKKLNLVEGLAVEVLVHSQPDTDEHPNPERVHQSELLVDATRAFIAENGWGVLSEAGDSNTLISRVGPNFRVQPQVGSDFGIYLPGRHIATADNVVRQMHLSPLKGVVLAS